MYQDQCFIRVLAASKSPGSGTNICKQDCHNGEYRMTVVEGYLADTRVTHQDKFSAILISDRAKVHINLSPIWCWRMEDEFVKPYGPSTLAATRDFYNMSLFSLPTRIKEPKQKSMTSGELAGIERYIMDIVKGTLRPLVLAYWDIAVATLSLNWNVNLVLDYLVGVMVVM
jgi:hypothetical protein